MPQKKEVNKKTTKAEKKEKAPYVPPVEEKISPEDAARKQAGADFIDALLEPTHARINGWWSLASGVAFRILSLGKQTPEQQSAGLSSTCYMHYTGRLIDGTKFDSSRDRGEVLVVKPHAVISGWGEVMQLMGVGDHWEIVIPQHQAYGKESKGKIPAYSALIFELELVQVNNICESKKKDAVAPPAKSAKEAREYLCYNVEKEFEELIAWMNTEAHAKVMEEGKA